LRDLSVISRHNDKSKYIETIYDANTIYGIPTLSTIEIPPVIEDNLGICSLGGTIGEGEREHIIHEQVRLPRAQSSIEFGGFGGFEDLGFRSWFGGT